MQKNAFEKIAWKMGRTSEKDGRTNETSLANHVLNSNKISKCISVFVASIHPSTSIHPWRPHLCCCAFLVSWLVMVATREQRRGCLRVARSWITVSSSALSSALWNGLSSPGDLIPWSWEADEGGWWTAAGGARETAAFCGELNFALTRGLLGIWQGKDEVCIDGLVQNCGISRANALEIPVLWLCETCRSLVHERWKSRRTSEKYGNANKTSLCDNVWNSIKLQKMHFSIQ